MPKEKTHQLLVKPIPDELHQLMTEEKAQNKTDDKGPKSFTQIALQALWARYASAREEAAAQDAEATVAALHRAEGKSEAEVGDLF